MCIRDSYNSILEAIGNTPIVRLNYFSKENSANIYGKVEALNPGGSVKSRTAYWMIKQALDRGLINKDTTLVEATSGNQGIGISMVGAVLGLSVIIVMPENMSEERQKMMKAYGAKVILTPAGRDIGEAIVNSINKAKNLVESNNRMFLLNQFGNPDNIEVHKKFTAQEILEQMDCEIDAFVSGIGTGGTITGIGGVLKTKFPNCLVVAAEPENGSILLNKGKKLKHHIQQGIGDGIIPDILNTEIIDKIILVSDKEALITARLLARKEGLFVGISSGTNVFVANRIAKELGKGKNIVTLLPDNGERYLSTELVNFKIWDRDRRFSG
ncbi:cysteine synthase A [Candidatus Atribacteria bacterium MT.SAG.1]|nr:cysteine synthase A [Candidatus Atribacteria bacterium MT.SAG.1]